MTPEMLKQVLDAFDKYGVKALDSIAANAVIQAWGSFFILGLVIGITVLVSYVFSKFYAKVKEEDWDHLGYSVGTILSGIGCVVCVIAILVNLFEIPANIATIKNPQAAAVRILLQR